MAEYIDREKVLKELDCGIRAGNYEEGYEKYQNINSIDDCVETVRYADAADVVERSKIEKAIEEIKEHCVFYKDSEEIASCLITPQQVLGILKKHIGE